MEVGRAKELLLELDDGWYLNAAGRNPTLWPGSTLRFRHATRRIDLTEYTVVPPPGR